MFATEPTITETGDRPRLPDHDRPGETEPHRSEFGTGFTKATHTPKLDDTEVRDQSASERPNLAGDPGGETKSFWPGFGKPITGVIHVEPKGALCVFGVSLDGMVIWCGIPARRWTLNCLIICRGCSVPMNWFDLLCDEVQGDISLSCNSPGSISPELVTTAVVLYGAIGGCRFSL